MNFRMYVRLRACINNHRDIKPVVVTRGLKRQQAAASTCFVGCFLRVVGAE